MKIITKYDYKNKVLAKFNGMIRPVVITGIITTTRQSGTKIVYETKSDHAGFDKVSFIESRIYSTINYSIYSDVVKLQQILEQGTFIKGTVRFKIEHNNIITECHGLCNFYDFFGTLNEISHNTYWYLMNKLHDDFPKHDVTNDSIWPFTEYGLDRRKLYFNKIYKSLKNDYDNFVKGVKDGLDYLKYE